MIIPIKGIIPIPIFEHPDKKIRERNGLAVADVVGVRHDYEILHYIEIYTRTLVTQERTGII